MKQNVNIHNLNITKHLKLMTILFVCLSFLHSKGQYHVQLMGGVMQFNSSLLYNPNNQNSRASYVSSFYINQNNKIVNPILGIGIGHIKNMGSEFPLEASSDVFRLSLGVITFGGAKWSQKFKEKNIRPHVKLAYTLEHITQNRLGGFVPNVGTWQLGGGLWFGLAKGVLVGYNYTLNQRLAQDYRTYHLHEFGFCFDL